MSIGSPVTVGREALLAEIRAAVEDVRAGTGRCLMLLGEAGSGKTRLLREALAAARASGMACLAGDQAATASPAPFGVLAGALRPWLRDASIDHAPVKPFEAGLRLVLPEWPGGEASADAAQVRLLALEGAFRLVASAAPPRGIALALDDLHQADPETLEFVHHAAASLERTPLLLLGAVRTGERSGGEEEARTLARRGRASVLEVPPLDGAATADLAAAIIGAPPPDGFAEEVLARTDGVPLLIEELVHASIAGGAVAMRGAIATWSRERVVPRSIVEITRQRLRAMPPETRRVVEAMAVLRRGDAEVLSAMTDASREEVLDALDRAHDLGMLEATEGGTRFRHALLQESAEAALLPERRRGLQRDAVAAIERVHGSDEGWLEERARHHEALGEHDAAAALLCEAARRALGSQAPASAESIAARALALEPQGEVARDLRDVLAAALSALGRRDQALRVDANGDETPERLVRMAGNAIRTGRQDDARGLLLRAAASGADLTRVKTLASLSALWSGDLDAAVADSTDAIALAERSGDASSLCDALDVFGRAHDMRGDRAIAMDAFRRWAEVAGAAGLTASRVQALMELGNAEFMTTYVPDALRETRSLAASSGAYPTLVLADLSLLWCLGATGDLDEALAIGDEALDIARRFELDLLPHVVEAVAWARSRRRHGDGDPLLEEAVALAPGDVDIVVQAHDAWADWQIRAGRFEDALVHLDRCVEIMLSNPAAVPLVAPAKRACVLAALGRDDARDALALARSVKPRLAIVPMWVDAAAAMVERSPEALEAALPADTTARYERATLLSLGAQIIGGERAGPWLREALATFERAGAEDDVARTRRLLRERGLSVPRARPGAAAVPEGLRARGVTRREAEVLALIGEALSNADIAARLFLSVRTVESHVSSLLTKLGVESRAALVASALASTTS